MSVALVDYDHRFPAAITNSSDEGSEACGTGA
jgi:hypothetical protein